MTCRETTLALRAFALSLPGAYEDTPWETYVTKVNRKIFVFFSGDAEAERSIRFIVKLPISGSFALNFPFTRPSGYNLGKSGWVAINFPPGDDPPLDIFQDWIAESYRTIAPKKPWRT